MNTFIVDSFTDVPFKGNPAGVCLCETELDEETMLNIAKELNLSETAFLQRQGASDIYGIPYFSPKLEIPLCGHATLASAKVLNREFGLDSISFVTTEGLELQVRISDDEVHMDFPVYGTEPALCPKALVSALGLSQISNSAYNRETKILLLEIDSTDELAKLSPDFGDLIRAHNTINGVLVTARAEKGPYDFHSRYFWPWSGTNEDPVTGGSHTFLAPYWASRLNKQTLMSFQSSERTGFMRLKVSEDNVTISGNAVIVFKGNFVNLNRLNST